MKIYILYDECEYHRIGYFANRYLAYEGAYDFYKSMDHPAPTFDAFWEKCCSLEEVTLVTGGDDDVYQFCSPYPVETEDEE